MEIQLLKSATRLRDEAFKYLPRKQVALGHALLGVHYRNYLCDSVLSG